MKDVLADMEAAEKYIESLLDAIRDIDEVWTANEKANDRKWNI